MNIRYLVKEKNSKLMIRFYVAGDKRTTSYTLAFPYTERKVDSVNCDMVHYHNANGKSIKYINNDLGVVKTVDIDDARESWGRLVGLGFERI